MNDLDAIRHAMAHIVRENVIALEEWPHNASLTPADFGLASDGLELRWVKQPDLFDVDALQAGLPELRVTHHDLIDSTNTLLVDAGRDRSVAQDLCIAEFQYGGRGRRGRTWVSPYGRNLAMSLGMSTSRSLPQLGGLSIVVGLAVAEVLEELGVTQVKLKWPNDLLVGNRKLSGILVELIQQPGRVEYVVGIGVNVSLSDVEIELIEQPVTDLGRCGIGETRTDLAIAFIDRVYRFLIEYEKSGFVPFVSAFNDLHKYQGQTCTISLGDRLISGVVTGIGELGELILQTDEGEQRFHGGEVSLRG